MNTNTESKNQDRFTSAPLYQPEPRAMLHKNILKHILDASPQMVLVCNDDNKVSYLNNKAQVLLQIFDFNPQYHVLSNLLSYRSYQFFKIAVVPVVQSRGNWFGELVFLTNDGCEILVYASVLGHKGASGTEYSISALDLTETRAKDNEIKLLTQLNEENQAEKAKKAQSAIAAAELKSFQALGNVQFAARVQKNMLQNEADLRMVFPDSFTLEYQRSMVSTSFYLAMKGKNGLKYVAVINCGAQGMQAGYISIAACSILTKAVQEFGMTQPSGMLEMLDGEIQKTFAGNTKTDGYNVSEGIEVSLCVVDTTNQKISFAGASRPMWLYSKNQLLQWVGTARTVGFGMLAEHKKDFRQEEMHFTEGDKLYLFSSGFKSKPMANILETCDKKLAENCILNYGNLPVNMQKNAFQHIIHKWKLTENQTDDICILGIGLK